jgi:putative ABC transport system permease protein
MQTIASYNLALSFLPVLLVIGIIYYWRLDYKTSVYALFRMLLQLLLIGYFLSYIFESDSALVVVMVLAVMLFSSSWIALRTVKKPKKLWYLKSLISIALGGGVVLFFITQLVLNLQPWYLPSFVISLAGMIFASAMNSVCLAAERFIAESARGENYLTARNIAFQASLIPMINALFAVGLVTLPGMMTGQVLSGISPLVAVKYQIMVMCMVFAASGLSSALFLHLIKAQYRLKKAIE